MKKGFRAALATTIVTICIVAGVSAASATNARQLDPPDCTTSAYGGRGTQSFTLNLTSNPCGYPVQAFVTCGNGVSSFGNTISNPGTSKVTCAWWNTPTKNPYGWRVQIGSNYSYHYLV
jgi:hypothetical protein